MRTIAASVVAAACFAAAVPAQAQAPGVDVKLNPRIGLYAPLTDLTEDVEGTYKMDNSLALGLGVEFDFAMLPVGLRANLDYATSSSVNFEDSTIEETDGTTVLGLVGDLVFRPLPRVVVLQPYLFAGGGIKKYDFEFDSADGLDSESDPTLHLGAGLDFGLGPLDLNAEVGDYISKFEPEGADSKVQHDVFVTIGFAMSLL